jgi:2-phospho-L-lactate transferase CofD
LWTAISKPYKETIQAFLIHFNTKVLRQANKKQFTFYNGSVSNFFLTGARIFFNSPETSLFWLSRYFIPLSHSISFYLIQEVKLCSPLLWFILFHFTFVNLSSFFFILIFRVVQIPSNSSVLPIINTNSTIHIGVELENGTIIHGQHEISHPTDPSSLPSPRFHPNLPHPPNVSLPPKLHHQQDTKNSPPQSKQLPSDIFHPLVTSPPPHLHHRQQQQQSPPKRQQHLHTNLVVDKNGGGMLEAKIKRLFYLNEDRQEILPPCNPNVLTKLREQDIIVYSIGSLWTRFLHFLSLLSAS